MLAPSKRLRMEAQRVLKDKVQDMAEAKGLKIRFCSLKVRGVMEKGEEGRRRGASGR